MKRKLIDSDEVLATLLKNPLFRKEMEKLEPQHQLERAIIEARMNNGLSQRDLAKSINSTQAVISRIESGSVSPSLNTINKIAMALGKKLKIDFVTR
ncbi:MAG: Toxin-antitoxin system, antitoxin component, Xre family [Candidatus Collierbacteria bacterium GW2011_GWC2_44_18]|uniref:Toxin-antitoxin system, antitoxin component, Xre family n=2 Tax=Microgenomates group TaxID=1794810 RepID=A0A0G1J8N4_9BACT|nr:MAG: Toxin-antitoxin system, antitoxin component, Xre family [Microgenomates group bacterium GW2011_GWC1_44_10]KKT49327.1 MAG: Toxin-antitoxin system, antitoxin component, Xre family [Candidatus Collierbacteria bacterium GW2011_GWC2_44_18]KKT67605.1 MAG: Toxin-antitoxin system, antitoxin component, Xre family [Candidatus Woesebacteria bacterium GW2011_GWA2_44_33]